MNLYLCKAVAIFFTAAISTIGAFLPILALMYFHFRLRKWTYRNRKIRLLKLKQAQEVINKINNDALMALYHSVGVDTYRALVESVISQPSNHWEKIRFVQEHLDRDREGREKMFTITTDISYIENYNFKTYLGILLDKKFPDKESK